MSVEALSWAFNLAPIPLDGPRRYSKTGTVTEPKPNAACHAVLLGLANHAGPDGTSAHPSVRTLMRYSSLSERAVRDALRRLEADKLIQPGDPDIVAAHIKRADRRPQGWDLAMGLLNLHLADDDLPQIERQIPGTRARLAAARAAAGWVEDDGGHLVPPVDGGHLVPPDGGHSVPPADPTGGTRIPDGGHSNPERGALSAPEPSLREPPSLEPPLVCTDPPTASQYKPSTQPTTTTAAALAVDANDEPLLLSPDDPASGQRPALRAVDDDAEFAEFWSSYPRHVAKGAARRAWKTARKRATADDIIAGARRYGADTTRPPQFTKHPATWLNSECWADETQPPTVVGRGTPRVWRDETVTAEEHARTADLFGGVSVNGTRIR